MIIQKSHLQCSIIAILAALLQGLMAEVVSAQDASAAVTDVTVYMMNGRKTIGQVDSTTDETHLVIRRSSANVVLRTRVLWTSINKVEIDKQTVSVNSFQQQWPDLKSDGPQSAFALSPSSIKIYRASDPESESVSSRHGNVMTITNELPASIAAATATGARSQASVRSLQFFTQAANWDDDVAIDGLLIHVRPVDASGHMVAINGTLDVKLIGLTQTLGGQVQQGRSPVEFPVLETWSQPIRQSDFTSEGAVYRLEFRRYQPDQDVNVEPIGLTNARLSVPSVGTFAATEDLTWLRPYSQIRDLHQMYRGTRILPQETRD